MDFKYKLSAFACYMQAIILFDQGYENSQNIMLKMFM